MKDYWPISKLHEWEENPRSVTPENFERLKKQILRTKEITGEYLYKPLLIKPDGTVIGGNIRLKALRELNVDKVWVNVIKITNAKELLEIALSDNDRVGKYEYDQLVPLLEKFPDLNLEDFTVDLIDAMNLKSLTSLEFKKEGFSEELLDEENVETKFKCPKCGYEF